MQVLVTLEGAHLGVLDIQPQTLIDERYVTVSLMIHGQELLPIVIKAGQTLRIEALP